MQPGLGPQHSRAVGVGAEDALSTGEPLLWRCADGDGGVWPRGDLTATFWYFGGEGGNFYPSDSDGVRGNGFKRTEGRWRFDVRRKSSTQRR